MRLQRTVDRIAGAAQLQVTAGEAGFPKRSWSGFRLFRGAGGGARHRGACGNQPRRAGNVLILGVDMTGDRSLREYDLESGDEAVVDDPLVFLAQPDSIIVTSEFADAERARRGRAPDAVDDDRRQSVHGARHHAVRRIDERLWRQSRGHGYLRRAAGVRPRPPVRSHRPQARRRASRSTAGELRFKRRSASGSRSSPPRRAGSSSNPRSPSTRSR